MIMIIICRAPPLTSAPASSNRPTLGFSPVSGDHGDDYDEYDNYENEDDDIKFDDDDVQGDYDDAEDDDDHCQTLHISTSEYWTLLIASSNKKIKAKKQSHSLDEWKSKVELIPQLNISLKILNTFMTIFWNILTLVNILAFGDEVVKIEDQSNIPESFFLATTTTGATHFGRTNISARWSFFLMTYTETSVRSEAVLPARLTEHLHYKKCFAFDILIDSR